MLPRLARAFDPRQPLAADHADDIGQVSRACPATLLDGDEPKPLGMAKGILDRPTTHPGPRGNLVDGPGTPTTVPVLVGDDAEDSHFGRREACS